MELTREQIKAMTLEEAKRIIEENGFDTSGELHRGCKQLYNWLYRKGLINSVYKGCRYSPSGHCTKSSQRKYDVTKVLPYLCRWAEEEGTTIAEQAGRYGYYYLFRDWCLEKGVDINTKKIDLENEKEK